MSDEEGVVMGEEPERLRAQAQDLATALRYAPGAYRSPGAADILDALLAEVERLAGERDGLLDAVERLNTTIERLSNAEKDRDEIHRDLKRTECECERLAGRVAALTRVLQRVDQEAEVAEGVTVDREAADVYYVSEDCMAYVKNVLRDVGGSE